MASTFVCPSCKNTLKTASPIAAGKKIKCPKCQTIFAVPADEGEENAVQAVIVHPPVPAAPPVEEPKREAERDILDDEDDRPRRGRKPRVRDDDEDLDEDDRPRRGRKSRRDEEDDFDDDDDRPRRRKSRSRDDDDDDGPRSRRGKKKGSSKLVPILLGTGGGLVLLLVIIGLFVWPGWLMSSHENRIIGNWELTKGDKKEFTEFKVQFYADKTVKVTAKAGPPFDLAGTYEITGDILTTRFGPQPSQDKIKSLTATDLILENDLKQIEEYKRLK